MHALGTKPCVARDFTIIQLTETMYSWPIWFSGNCGIYELNELPVHPESNHYLMFIKIYVLYAHRIHVTLHNEKRRCDHLTRYMQLKLRNAGSNRFYNVWYSFWNLILPLDFWWSTVLVFSLCGKTGDTGALLLDGLHIQKQIYRFNIPQTVIFHYFS